MAGQYNLNGGRPGVYDGSNANNGYIRYIEPSDYYRVYIGVNLPANAYISEYSIQGLALNTGFYSWSDGYFRWTGRFYGNDDPYGPAAQAIRNGSVIRTWGGGVGGYVKWRYYAPGKPTLNSSSRSANGTSLTFQVNSGSGRVTANYTSLDQGGWQSNPKTYTVGAHESVTLYGLSANEDGNSGWANLGTSHGIPNASTFTPGQGAIPDSTVSGRIGVSWTAPTYLGAGLTRYDVYRSGTTGAIYSGTSRSFTDSGLTPGITYTYSIYAINSTGQGVVATTSAVAPGTPSAPGIPSISKVGRNVTITSAMAPINAFGNTVTAYRARYRTTENPSANPVVWSNWSTAVPMIVDGTNIVKLFELLPPALTYQFQTYAVNGITRLADGTTVIDPDNYNFATSTTIFVSAGGRRKIPGAGFEPTQTAKRYDSTRPDGQKWVDLNTAKRYSSAANGGAGGWVDLS